MPKHLGGFRAPPRESQRYEGGSRGFGGGGGSGLPDGRSGHPGAKGSGKPPRATAERGTSEAEHGNALPVSGHVRKKRPRCANEGTAAAPPEARRYSAEIAGRCQSRRGDSVSAGSEVAPRLALGPLE